MKKVDKIVNEDENIEYEIGNFINHSSFGAGEIINVIPGEAIKVRFGKKERILLLKFNSTTIKKS